MKNKKLYICMLSISLSLCNAKFVMAENINNIFNNQQGGTTDQQPLLQTLPQVNPNQNNDLNSGNTSNVNNQNANTINAQNPMPVVNNQNQLPPQTGGNSVPPMSNNLDNTTTLDNNQKTINDIKRQTALLEAQKALDNAKYGNQKTMTTTPQINNNNISNSNSSTDQNQQDIITATMKNYISFKNGNKIATIMFANGATTEVEIGSILYSYKVTKINEQGVFLRPLKKGKNIVLQRNLPINQTQNQAYNYQLTAPSYNSLVGQN